ncbi:o-methyltransferase family protein [Ophiostoma piceae UAMH 11346]|uniref:O-methyltransferase family protein n=1 Tax=Ophiostoma piceae (strain UAMH 11346) TaxID=1262450 RepID=S3CAU8_OPHP1|nr:o-methyltransferase family protein [Ophiostoma piceae UAMH 11346]
MKSNVPALYPNTTVGERVLEYAANKSSEIPEALLKYHAEILNLENSIMSISTYQAQAMSFLAKVAGAKRILEIGVFRGFSAMVWSHAVGPTGTVTGLEKSPEYAAFAKKALADHDIKNVTVIEGDALETLKGLDPEEPYDIVFIDAQKWGYPGYLKTVLEKSAPGATGRLLRPGGLIIADNVLRAGVVADPSSDNPETGYFGIDPSKTTGDADRYGANEDLKALDEFSTTMRESPRIDSWLVPLFDGIGMGRLLD